MIDHASSASIAMESVTSAGILIGFAQVCQGIAPRTITTVQLVALPTTVHDVAIEYCSQPHPGCGLVP